MISASSKYMKMLAVGILLCLLASLSYGVAVYKDRDTQALHKQGGVLVPKATINKLILNWDLPTERVDGSPLLVSEIKGYVIEYWRNPENVVQVNVPSVTSTSLKNLVPGRYFMRIATRDTDERVGPFSNIISVEVP